MTQFEYVTVITSLILGLGLAQILTGLANMILVWEKVRFYLPHTLWVILVFFFHLQEWWVSFGHSRSIEAWSMLDFFFVVIYPILLFLMSRMMFPSKFSKDIVDLHQYWNNNFRRIFIVGLCMPLISIPQNLFILKLDLESQFGQVFYACILFWFAITGNTNRWLHLLCALLIMLFAFFYILWINPVL